MALLKEIVDCSENQQETLAEPYSKEEIDDAKNKGGNKGDNVKTA